MQQTAVVLSFVIGFTLNTERSCGMALLKVTGLGLLLCCLNGPGAVGLKDELAVLRTSEFKQSERVFWLKINSNFHDV